MSWRRSKSHAQTLRQIKRMQEGWRAAEDARIAHLAATARKEVSR